jgi:hypothetical protein
VILSDMARQLEEALRRPAMPVPPPAPPAPVNLPEGIEDEDELLEPTAPQDHGPVPVSNAPFQDEPEEEQPRAPEQPVAAAPPRPVDHPVRPAPPPVQPDPSPAETPAPPKPAPKAADPFSVDEIEAEFARLLGRPLDAGKKE